MLREVKPDAVNACMPNGLHADAVIDACNAGCHAITEKPMAMNPAECKKMIDAAKKKGKKLAVGFQYRYHPNTELLVRAREDGMFGNIMYARVQALRRRGIPNWGVFGRKELQGGGPMIDIGVHVIEMTHYTMGRPKPVAAVGNTWTYLGNKKSHVQSMWPNWDYKTYTVEDLAIGHVRFDNGAIMHIESSFAAHIKEDTWNFQLIGDKGGATWDPPMLFHDQAGTMFNSAPGWISTRTDFPSLFTAKLRNFVDACLKDTPLNAPGDDGMTVQKIIDGIYRSAEHGGKEIAID
jgi:predicted dehydrogenase